MKLILTLFTCLFVTGCAYAQNFSDYFTNKTLRIDYLFTGNADKQSICLDELSELPVWAGRRHHLSELPLEGNGQIVMRDVASGKVIYTTSFSSLFHNGSRQMKPKRSPKDLRILISSPIP